MMLMQCYLSFEIFFSFYLRFSFIFIFKFQFRFNYLNLFSFSFRFTNKTSNHVQGEPNIVLFI